MSQRVFANHSRVGSRVQKPDSTRLRVLGVNIAPGGVHRQPRRLVWTTVVNHGKVYPYASTKRSGGMAA